MSDTLASILKQAEAHGILQRKVVKGGETEYLPTHPGEASTANKAAVTPPKPVQQAAALGLELRRQFGRGGTEVGVARARDLSNGRAVSEDTLTRMRSYFARHAVDAQADGWKDEANPSAGWIAWLLWGGDEGRDWAEGMLSEAEKQLTFFQAEKQHTGAMLALYPDTPPEFSLMDQDLEPTAPDELHVTMAYLGDAADLDEEDRAFLRRVCEQIASEFNPIQAKLGGIGRFLNLEDDDTQAYYANVDSPDIESLRARIMQVLGALGLLPDSDHGFTPHMTLAYVPVGKPAAGAGLQEEPVEFGGLSLSLAGERERFPFKASGAKQNIMLTYPDESKPHRFVWQQHFRGKSAHGDFRVESGDYLVGWTIPDQIPGAITEPVETLAQATTAVNNPNLWKMNLTTGEIKPREIRSGVVRKGDLRALPKGVEIPEDWLNEQGVTDKPDPGEAIPVGATRNYPGVFKIVDKGTVEHGAKKPWLWEVWIHGEKWGTQRWLFRLLERNKEVDHGLQAEGWEEEAEEVEFKYSPGQARDESGRWAGGAGDFNSLPAVSGSNMSDTEFKQSFEKAGIKPDNRLLMSNAYWNTGSEWVNDPAAEDLAIEFKSQGADAIDDAVDNSNIQLQSFTRKIQYRGSEVQNAWKQSSQNGGEKANDFLQLEASRRAPKGSFDETLGMKLADERMFPEEKKLSSVIYNDIHERSQSALRQRGIDPEDTLTLYRGIHGDYGKDLSNSLKPGDEFENFTARPLSSWSADPVTAFHFSRGEGVVVAVQVKAKDIFSFYPSGLGCARESEIVVPAGKVKRAKVVFSANPPSKALASMERIRFDDDDANADWIRFLERESERAAKKRERTKADTLPPGVIEQQPRGETFWVFMQPDDQTPYVLGKEAVDKDWLPPKGVSALPKVIRERVPKELRYWEVSGKEALDRRAKLAEMDIRELGGSSAKYSPNQPRDEAGRFGSSGVGAIEPSGKVSGKNFYSLKSGDRLPDSVLKSPATVALTPDGKLLVVEGGGVAHSELAAKIGDKENYDRHIRGEVAKLPSGLSLRVMSDTSGVGSRLAESGDREKIDLVAERNLGKLARRMSDAGYPSDMPVRWYHQEGGTATRTTLEAMKSFDEEKQLDWHPYKLQRRWWRGQVVIRFGPSDQSFDLWLDQSGKPWHLVVEGNPLTNDRLPAYEESYNLTMATADGKRVSVLRIGSEPIELAPGQSANPTKDTPAFIQTVDEGEARVIDDQPEFKKMEFKGGKLKGAWYFRLESPDSKIGEFGKSEGPAVKGEKGVRPLFGSPGGKRLLAKTIVDLIPPHKVYVEPFAGGAAVLFAKPPEMSEKEVLADADPDIAFAYRTVKRLSDAEIERLNGMEWRIGKFDEVKESKPEGELGRLHKWLYMRKSSQGALGGNQNLGQPEGRDTHARNLPDLRDRLASVTVRSAKYPESLKEWDRKETFFYLDPPYPATNLGSSREELRWEDEDCAAFADAVKKLKGKWLVSLQDNQTNRDLFKGYSIRTVSVPTVFNTGGGKGNDRRELLIANYPLPKRVRRKAYKWRPDQPRNESGQFASGGGGNFSSGEAPNAQEYRVGEVYGLKPSKRVVEALNKAGPGDVSVMAEELGLESDLRSYQRVNSEWTHGANPEAKEAIAEMLESNPELRTLTLYNNYRDDSLTFDEYLDKPVRVYRYSSSSGTPRGHFSSWSPSRKAAMDATNSSEGDPYKFVDIRPRDWLGSGLTMAGEVYIRNDTIGRKSLSEWRKNMDVEVLSFVYTCAGCKSDFESEVVLEESVCPDCATKALPWQPYLLQHHNDHYDLRIGDDFTLRLSGSLLDNEPDKAEVSTESPALQGADGQAVDALKVKPGDPVKLSDGEIQTLDKGQARYAKTQSGHQVEFKGGKLEGVYLFGPEGAHPVDLEHIDVEWEPGQPEPAEPDGAHPPLFPFEPPQIQPFHPPLIPLNPQPPVPPLIPPPGQWWMGSGEVAEGEKVGKRIKTEKLSKLQELRNSLESAVKWLGEVIGWASYQDAPEPTMLEFFKGSDAGFTVKTVQGEPWLFTWSANAFKDREGEIFSTKALENWADAATARQDKGSFNFWHIPGSDFATKRWVGVPGRILVEAGPFTQDEKGQAAQKFFAAYPDRHPTLAPEGWGCSVEYRYLPEERKEKVYRNVEITRTSVLPRFAAANTWTAVKEVTMALTEAQKKAAQELFGEDLAASILGEAEAKTKELEPNVAHKGEGEQTEPEAQVPPEAAVTEEVTAEDDKAKKKPKDAAMADGEPYPKPTKAEKKQLDQFVKAIRDVAASVTDDSPGRTAILEVADKLSEENLKDMASELKKAGKAVKNAAQKARLTKLVEAMAGDGTYPAPGEGDGEGYPYPKSKEFVEEVAAEVGKQFKLDVAPIGEALTATAAALKGLEDRITALETQSGRKAATDLPRFVFGLVEQASKADATIVPEGDKLLDQKPKETSRADVDGSIAAHFFPKGK